MRFASSGLIFFSTAVWIVQRNEINFRGQLYATCPEEYSERNTGRAFSAPGPASSLPLPRSMVLSTVITAFRRGYQPERHKGRHI